MNVLLHAGTSLAWVEVRLAGDVLVQVRDAGAGFDAGRLDPSRLGVRRSIIERLADAGGEASVRSVPGSGTVVSLRWPRRGAPPAGPGPDEERPCWRVTGWSGTPMRRSCPG